MWDDLKTIEPHFHYRGARSRYIAFPLGGLGTGGFSISGSGRLVDWSIRNRPALQNYNGYSHFAIKAERDGTLVDARVLNGPYDLNPAGAPGMRKMFDGFGHGANRQTLAGVPHFRSVDFYGRFPTADLVFADERFPGSVRLTAFSPFIPHDDRNSSMPVAMLEFEIVNTSKDRLDYTLAGTLGNYGSNSGDHRFVSSDGLHALHLSSADPDLAETARGDLTIATDAPFIEHTDYHFRGQWFDDLAVYWKEFARPGRLPTRRYEHPRSRHMYAQPEHATLGVRLSLASGERRRVRFVIAWNFPKGDVYWAYRDKPDGVIPDRPTPSWTNYYSTLWPSSLASARDALSRWDDLAAGTFAFRDSLFGSTLPVEVKDAASATLALLRTATVIRLEGGELWGWEGQHTQDGSCEGSCTHVWNYQQALSHLFPAVERTLRETEFAYNMLPSGGLTFRQKLPLGSGFDIIGPCADGHFGAIVKTCRDWKLSGDTDLAPPPVAQGQEGTGIRLVGGQSRPLGSGQDRHSVRPPTPDAGHGAVRAELLAGIDLCRSPVRGVRNGRGARRGRTGSGDATHGRGRRRLHRHGAVQRSLVRPEDRPRRQVDPGAVRRRPQCRRTGRPLHGRLLVG